jgi:hypothetical protein
MIGKSGDTVCDLHHTHGGDEKRGFPGLASNLVVMVCQWFGFKITVTFLGLGHKTKVDGLVIWASKSLCQFLGLGLKTKWKEVCQFAPQN